MIYVNCESCGSRLKVPEKLAGKAGKCPKCSARLVIPLASDPQSELDESLDFGLPEESLQIPIRRIARASAKSEEEDDLEFIDEAPSLSTLPRKARKKKPRSSSTKAAKVETDSTRYLGDKLVWAFLMAMIPLAISMFLPTAPLEERVKKLVQQNDELISDFDAYGARDFIDMHPEVTLDGAHLSRNSLVHWLYAFLATGGFLVLLNAMRYQTSIKPWALLATGVFTGTIGIAMLLVFQLFAEISLHLRVPLFGSFFSLILLAVKFIGFSYRCALDPNCGFLLSFVGFTCGVGFCEELCKAIPLFVYLRNTRNSDWRGTCLMGFASGAGFGISEGIMYAGSYYNGIEPGLAYLVRFLSCVALHAVLSGGVALLMFGNQDYLDGDSDWGTFLFGLLQYIFISMILHGLYDTFLKQNINILALLVALGAFSWLAWLSHYYWDYEPTPRHEGVIY